MSDRNSLKQKKRLNCDHGGSMRKRGRYTAAACNECKKRKTKCSGSIPCRSCSNLDIECVYSAESAEALSQKNTATIIQDLQKQVRDLWEAVDAINRQAESGLSIENSNSAVLDPVNFSNEPSRNDNNDRLRLRQSSSRKRRNSLRALGPTSSGYGLQIAEPALRDMGVPVMSEDDAREARHYLASPRHGVAKHVIPGPLHNILLEISSEKMLELIDVYAEEIGLQYPFLNIPSVIRYVKLVFSNNSQLIDAYSREKNGCKLCDDGREDILAGLLAVSMAAQRGDSDVDMTDALISSLEHPGIQKGPQKVEIDRHDLIILILKGMYYFFRKDERLAWRTIGIAARMCEEAGLNRQSIVLLNYEDANEKEWMVKLFWSIYVLDRRWSFGTGLSFALQDTSINLSPELPEDYGSRYLRCMIDYCHVASKVWQNNLVPLKTTGTQATDEHGFLEYLISDWLRTIPPDLQLSNPEDGYDPSKNDRGIFRLQTLLYLRANQMRILIYRNELLTQSGMITHKDRVQETVDRARETIRILVSLNKTSNIYRTQQICFNHFLDSALTVLVLAICHAPAEYPRTCRGEFYSALELIQTLSMPSPISTRLWQVVHKLKHVAFPEKPTLIQQASAASLPEDCRECQSSSDSQPNPTSTDQIRRPIHCSSNSQHQDISTLFWELFDAGNCSFMGGGEPPVLDSQDSGYPTEEARATQRVTPSTSGLSNLQAVSSDEALITTSESSSTNFGRNRPDSIQATDITGQRSLQRTELDFFDLASIVQSPNIAELSNEMFFF